MLCKAHARATRDHIRGGRGRAWVGIGGRTRPRRWPSQPSPCLVPGAPGLEPGHSNARHARSRL